MVNDFLEAAEVPLLEAREPVPVPVPASLRLTKPGTPHAVDFGRNIHCVLGLTFDALSLDEAVAQVHHAAHTGTPCFVSTPNVNFLIAAQTDAPFRASVLHSDLSVADGMPIVWIARLLGVPIRERVAGADLFDRLRVDARQPLGVYFFGGPDGVAESASRQLNVTPGGLRGVGGESPGAGTVTDLCKPESLARINASGAQLLAVALGAKKGQAWIELNRASLSVPVISHLGAVVNFVEGRLARAPVWARRLGIEWCWRILGERSLWRRYWNDGRSLAALAFTRLVSTLWLMRVVMPLRRFGSPGDVSISDAATHFKVTVKGAWRSDAALPLRLAFSRAADSDKAVEVIFEPEASIDLGVVGLLLLLEEFCSQRAIQVTIVPGDTTMRRLFELCDLRSLAQPVLVAR